MYLALLPPALICLFATATLLLGLVSKRGSLTPFVFVAQLIVAWSYIRQAQSMPVTAHIAVDGLSLFGNAIVGISVLALIAIAYRYLEISGENRAEFYSLAMFAQCGMYFMCAGADLITIVLGIELTAVSFYILVGFTRGNLAANEASLKYLLLGAVSSAFVLYGFSIVYGVTGTTDLASATAVLARRDAFGLLAAATVIAGLSLKIAAAPFHTWAPDAYDGAPTPVTAYLSVASKTAAFIVFMRLFPHVDGMVQFMLSTVAVLSLTLGSVAAITQERTKRLFAYSGIAHAGYLLLGLISGSRVGVLVYLVAYALMNLGAFAVLASLRRHGFNGDLISDLRGLSKTHPVQAALFGVLTLSLAGIPPSAGFIGKYYIFAALIKTGQYTLAAVAAGYVIVSTYFYFRLVREIYLEPREAAETISSSFGAKFALAATSAATLIFGLFPEPMLRGAAWLLS